MRAEKLLVENKLHLKLGSIQFRVFSNEAGTKARA